MAYDELTARLAKQVSQLEQALAEKDREYAQLKEAYDAKVAGDLDREKRLSRYKSEAFYLGVAGVIVMMVVN